MSFTIDSYSGYETGKRYQEHLAFVRMYGNAKKRYVILKDENGVELHWTTNDYTKVYKNFKRRGVYRFTVDHIVDYNKNINIRNMALVE